MGLIPENKKKEVTEKVGKKGTDNENDAAVR